MWLSTLPSCKAGNKNIGKGKVKHTGEKVSEIISRGNPFLLCVTNNFMAKSHMHVCRRMFHVPLFMACFNFPVAQLSFPGYLRILRMQNSCLLLYFKKKAGIHKIKSNN